MKVIQSKEKPQAPPPPLPPVDEPKPLAMDDLASPDYRALLRTRREPPDIPRDDPVDDIKTFAELTGSRSILDYGCGAGKLKDALPEFDVREYDPGVDGKDALPERADLVVAIDVLQCVEPDKIENVLKHIRELSQHGILLTIPMRPGHGILPDGSNPHRILQSPASWRRQLLNAGMVPARMLVRRKTWVWIKTDGKKTSDREIIEAKLKGVQK